MSLDITIEGAYFITGDSVSGEEYIRELRSEVTYKADVNDAFRFFYKEPNDFGSINYRLLGADKWEYAYASIGTVTEDGTVVSIANANALKTYLSSKVGFFFNPNVVNNDNLLVEDLKNTNKILLSLNELIEEQKLTNKYLRKIYNPE